MEDRVLLRGYWVSESQAVAWAQAKQIGAREPGWFGIGHSTGGYMAVSVSGGLTINHEGGSLNLDLGIDVVVGQLLDLDIDLDISVSGDGALVDLDLDLVLPFAGDGLLMHALQSVDLLDGEGSPIVDFGGSILHLPWLSEQ